MNKQDYIRSDFITLSERVQVLTCAIECAAGVVAALGLVRNLPRGTVEMQVSGDPAGLNSYQVTPNTWT